MTKFHGTLTIENIAKVTKIIEEMLTDKKYTFVDVNELFDFRPEVRINQKLKNENPINVWYDKDNNPPKYGGFNVNDTYGVWGLSTSQTTNEYDSKFNAPYVVIEYNQIKMTLRSASGNLIHWIIVIQ